MSAKSLNILGNSIEPGESIQIILEVAKLHTRTNIGVPIIINRSLYDGPTILLMGGIHGDEINGIEIVRRIIRRGINRPKIGTVICIPVFNIFGFLNLSRQFPDGRDLNRVFPGNRRGSLASMFAYAFSNEIAPFVDYVIDYHTGGADRINAPQVRCVFDEEKNFELAQAFGAPFVINSPRIPKSVRDTLFKMGKSSILFEGGKSNSFDEEVIQCGVKGAINVMNFLGMHDYREENYPETIALRDTYWMRVPTSGMLHLKVKNGSKVYKHSIIGLITDPYGEFEREILAPHDCYIFCTNSSPIVNRGDAMFNISREI